LKNQWIIDKELSEYILYKNEITLFAFILHRVILIIENLIRFLHIN